MDVHGTIVKMMQAYPTLNSSRKAALNNLFNGSHAEWVDGELVLRQDSGYFDREDHQDSLNVIDPDEDLHMRLFYLRENADIEFTVEHAELLADDTHSHLERNQPDMYWISSLDDRWADMPENVTAEWAAAADEIAWDVFRLTEGCKEGTHGYNSHRTIMKYLLSRGKIGLAEKHQRIKELEAELELYRKYQ